MRARYIILVFVIITKVSNGQLIDKSPPPVPTVPTVFDREPWEDPAVSGINRDAARTTAYSFASIQDALAGNRERSGRMMLLNGAWDFAFATKPSEAPTDFFKEKVKGP